MNESNGAQPDWELAKGLYLKRVSHREIVAQTGVSLPALRKRIDRGGWLALRQRTESAAPEKIPLARRSEIVRECIAADLQTTCEQLPELKRSNDPVRLKERQEVIGSLANAGEKIFGWRDSGPRQSFISLTFLNSARVGTATPEPAPAVIDGENGKLLTDSPPVADAPGERD